MSEFIHDNFLLQNAAAVRLYHGYAKDMPIIDYHCHLPPKDVAEDRQFENLTQIWLAGDHYKWRAMRAAGVSEEYITGNASDWEKFQAWAEVVPKTLRNPLYHWTHLELKRPFGISDRLLEPDTAKSIWDETNALLQTPEFSARGIMRQMNVKLVCTTDDPADDLRWHQKIAADESFDIQVLPTFRPDKAFIPRDAHNKPEAVESYNQYIDRLGGIAGIEIKEFDDLLAALDIRHRYFHENGCRLSDHGLHLFSFQDFSWTDNGGYKKNFPKLRQGEGIFWSALNAFLLFYLGKLNCVQNWTMQLHIGAIRNNNSKMFRALGADTGFDSIVDDVFTDDLLHFFDELNRDESLPKTVVYNLNPSWNEVLVTALGNFQSAHDVHAAVKLPKMQFGSAWWFLDQKDGMEKQLDCLSNLGLLSGFVGMLTDSRSFLSYTRHEYFRRILCNRLGQEIEQGLLPNDWELIGKMVQDICYNNAKNYFGFD